MTLTAMATYFSAFLNPLTYFDYDPLARPNMTSHEKELAEVYRQIEEKKINDKERKARERREAFAA